MDDFSLILWRFEDIEMNEPLWSTAERYSQSSKKWLIIIHLMVGYIVHDSQAHH
jgi:hypothetical protein